MKLIMEGWKKFINESSMGDEFAMAVKKAGGDYCPYPEDMEDNKLLALALKQLSGFVMEGNNSPPTETDSLMGHPVYQKYFEQGEPNPLGCANDRHLYRKQPAVQELVDLMLNPSSTGGGEGDYYDLSEGVEFAKKLLSLLGQRG